VLIFIGGGQPCAIDLIEGILNFLVLPNTIPFMAKVLEAHNDAIAE